MSDAIGTAYVEIKPETDKFEKDLHSSASRIGATAGKVLAVGLGGGLVAAGALFKTGLGEVKDYQAGLAQLEAGIKSTGGAAGVSATHLEDLASSIEGYSGQTDDSIVKTEQLLLTFTNIKNSGPDKIFDDTTRAAADMAAKLGGDASASAMQLGKALNDPIKGVTALTRVGVSFTEGQKATIAQMVKTGDTIGAQKLILGELNKEFGGSAEAFGKTMPGQIEIAKRSFEGISQQFVTDLLPAITGVMKLITHDLLPGLKTMIDFTERNSAVIKPLAAVLGTATVAFLATSKALAIAGAAAELFGTELTVATGPIGLAVAAVAALAVGVIYAYKHSETFRKIVDTLGSTIRSAVVGTFNGAKAVVNGLGDAFGAIAGKVEAVIGFIERLAHAIKNLPGVGAVTSLIGHIPGFATGGVLAPGLSMVGEKGPELMFSPRGGERVVSHEQSKQMLDAAGGARGGGDTHIHVTAATTKPHEVARAVELALFMGGL